MNLNHCFIAYKNAIWIAQKVLELLTSYRIITIPSIGLMKTIHAHLSLKSLLASELHVAHPPLLLPTHSLSVFTMVFLCWPLSSSHMPLVTTLRK